MVRYRQSREPLIELDQCEVLTEATIDNFHFRVTLNPVHFGTCILWFRDVHVSDQFEALGKFSRFERRSVLDFVVRYTTSMDLREEIEHRRFARRIENLSPTYFRQFEHLDDFQKDRAYRELFDLDSVIEQDDLAYRRKIMAKKFHPDRGGDQRVMTLINEAYDFLSERAKP